MDFVKKYWWAFLLGILVLAWLGWYIKPKNGAPKQPSCKQKSKDDYLAALRHMESEIDGMEGWANKVRERTRQVYHPCFNKSYEECLKMTANNHLIEVLKFCPQEI